MEQNNIPADVQERIKVDAQKFSYMGIIYGRHFYNDDKINGYIAGATTEAERAQKLAEDIQLMLDQCDYSPEKSWYEIICNMKGIGLNALQQWKDRKEVELTCMVCGSKFMGPEPKMCCSGRDCGCMGLPTEPIVCSKECYEKGIPPQNGDSGATIELPD